MKTVNKTRIISVVLMFLMALLACMFLSEMANAASWPGLSRNGYCETVSPRKIDVYMDNLLSSRGTSSPLKQYNAYISSGDVIKIYSITPSFIYLAYPTSSGYREGFIRRSDLISVSYPSARIDYSELKVTTYKIKDGGTSGYIARGDNVYRVDTSSNWISVIYTAKSGSRAYKLAWIRKSDYDSIVNRSFTANFLASVYQTGYLSFNRSAYATLYNFYKDFNSNAKYDVKRKKQWMDVFDDYPYPSGETKYLLYGRWWNAEDIGNIFYGFVGASCGISLRTLYQGGGYAKSGFKYLKCPPYYGDDINDHLAIEFGANLIGGGSQKIDYDISKYEALLNIAKFLGI